MAVAGGIMVPHPPLIIPEVGRGGEKEIQKTIDAYRKAARFVTELQPETLIVSTPHSVMYRDYFHISPGRAAHGSFRQFRAGNVKLHADYDTKLRETIVSLCEREHFPAGTDGERDSDLDHATMIPLYFLNEVLGIKDGKCPYPIIRIGLSGLSLADHYHLGELCAKAAETLNRRVVWIASGDLSHKLKSYGPYGYDAAGPEYDRRIMDVMGRAAFDELLDFDEPFLEKAAECGHRSFVMMAGALDGLCVETEKLSHEDVTGVGYGVCIYRVTGENDDGPVSEGSGNSGKAEKSMENSDPQDAGSLGEVQKSTGNSGATGKRESRHMLKKWKERHQREVSEKRAKEDPYVQLARAQVELYVSRKKRMSAKEVRAFVEERTSAESQREELLKKRAGAFVSIHENGALRGCIGTIGPTASCVAEEIAQNAVSAATRDPRFPAIRTSELDDLEISVDVLGDTEPVNSPDELDVKKYGVIVTKGRRRGLLLPNLDGVDTVEDQISIALQKAGLDPDEENYSLERFEVVRHF